MALGRRLAAEVGAGEDGVELVCPAPVVVVLQERQPAGLAEAARADEEDVTLVLEGAHEAGLVDVQPAVEADAAEVGFTVGDAGPGIAHHARSRHVGDRVHDGTAGDAAAIGRLSRNGPSARRVYTRPVRAKEGLMVTEEHKQQLDRDGYCVVRGLFDDAETVPVRDPDGRALERLPRLRVAAPAPADLGPRGPRTPPAATTAPAPCSFRPSHRVGVRRLHRPSQAGGRHGGAARWAGEALHRPDDLQARGVQGRAQLLPPGLLLLEAAAQGMPELLDRPRPGGAGRHRPRLPARHARPLADSVPRAVLGPGPPARPRRQDGTSASGSPWTSWTTRTRT